MNLQSCALKLNVPVNQAKLHNADYDNQIAIKAYGQLITKLKSA